MTALQIKNDVLQMIVNIDDVKVLKEIRDFLEELNDIRLYDEAKAVDEPSIPINEAFEMIEIASKKQRN